MSSGHYGYWCATCNIPIKDGEQVIDVPNGIAHAACHCAVCKAPINLRDVRCDLCGLDYESATHDECR